MANIIKHKFVSAKSQSPDNTLVSKNEWNDEHAFAGGSNGQYLKRDSTQTDGAIWATLPPYDFVDVVAVHSADNTGVSNASAAIQAAINAYDGRPLYLKAGTYRLDAQLTHNTSGDVQGLKMFGAGNRLTLLDTRVANAAAISLDGSGTPFDFAMGSVLKDFAIITNGAPANPKGIDIKGLWHTLIDSVRIIGLSAEAIYCDSSAGDADSCQFVEIARCWIQSCGYGIRSLATGTGTNMGFSWIHDNYIIFCTTAGIRLNFVEQTKIQRNSLGDNGVGLIIGPASAATGASRIVGIEENEFQSNVTAQIQIIAGIGVDIVNNSEKADNSQGTFRPLIGYDIGPTAGETVQNVMIRKTNVRVLNPTTHTVFRVGSVCDDVKIVENSFVSIPAPTIKYSDSGRRTTVSDGAERMKEPSGYCTTDIAAGNTYTPDILLGSYHRIVVTSAGALTIANPLNIPLTGSTVIASYELILDIFNNSGGVITVVWGANYKTTGFVAPANGSRVVVHFHSDTNNMIPVGGFTDVT